MVVPPSSPINAECVKGIPIMQRNTVSTTSAKHVLNEAMLVEGCSFIGKRQCRHGTVPSSTVQTMQQLVVI